MDLAEKMETGSIYHVFNHANGWEDIFAEERNYHHFMGGLFRRVSPAIDLHAWCLMPNHFHLAVGIPGLTELVRRDTAFDGLTEEEATRRISKSFANCSSSYTLSFNKMYNRMGSLFRPNLKWKPLDDEFSLCKLVHYIHANPVHHGFVQRMEDWPHSSFNRFVSMPESMRSENLVLKSYGGYQGFMRYHEQPIVIRHPDMASERNFLKMLTRKRMRTLLPKSV